MIFTALLAAQALPASNIQPNAFYVMGIQQGMTLAEYNALIANGRYRSEPIGPDAYAASINGQDISVNFCEGKVFRVFAHYNSYAWMNSMKTLEDVGFKWGAPFYETDTNKIHTSKMTFAITVPKGYSFFAAPMIKSSEVNGKDFPVFQIMFEATDSSCR